VDLSLQQIARALNGEVRGDEVWKAKLLAHVIAASNWIVSGAEGVNKKTVWRAGGGPYRQELRSIAVWFGPGQCSL